MYSIIIKILIVIFLLVTGFFAIKSSHKLNSLIKWLQVFFAVSFIACISLVIYYTHYYLGGSQYLQKVYFTLFYITVVLFFFIVILKIKNFYKKKSNN